MADIEISADMPGMEDAVKRLDEMIAADSNPVAEESRKAAEEASSQDSVASVTIEPDHAAQQVTNDAAAPDKPVPADTQAAADKADDDKDQTSKETGTRYEKAKARQEKSWAELNRQKDEFKAQQLALEAERRKLADERTSWQKEREKAERRYKPEDYEKAADDWEAQGKYDLAEAARDRAKQLRETPDVNAVADQSAKVAEREKLQKEWYSKAAIDFPEVARNGSDQNAKLKALLAAEPDVLNDPKGMYYASRLVAAETSAARVPVMEKELGELRAKVKELESNTMPSLPGSSTPAKPAMGNADEFARLEQMAREIGTFR